ncbi:mitochondrial inner membrane protein-domain-containing protein [Fimicolochytrium jonesii]|uniref:mitochondrial inner membrane protein-domain-containing protein n=1 Tax=Fimicolochytrium jonesii TaxID=1396493 RepID=UPI0022FE54C8|nr:mitochondrial inner membrane protein-domain-containing protein [Fimicolochytrium jonesii]KAI8822409.1 mitochondrial inner membrane protein-domain-containing protein [Fimicolochytrium jonesii]
MWKARCALAATKQRANSRQKTAGRLLIGRPSSQNQGRAVTTSNTRPLTTPPPPPPKPSSSPVFKYALLFLVLSGAGYSGAAYYALQDPKFRKVWLQQVPGGQAALDQYAQIFDTIGKTSVKDVQLKADETVRTAKKIVDDVQITAKEKIDKTLGVVNATKEGANATYKAAVDKIHETEEVAKKKIENVSAFIGSIKEDAAAKVDSAQRAVKHAEETARSYAHSVEKTLYDTKEKAEDTYDQLYSMITGTPPKVKPVKPIEEAPVVKTSTLSTLPPVRVAKPKVTTDEPAVVAPTKPVEVLVVPESEKTRGSTVIAIPSKKDTAPAKTSVKDVAAPAIDVVSGAVTPIVEDAKASAKQIASTVKSKTEPVVDKIVAAAHDAQDMAKDVAKDAQVVAKDAIEAVKDAAKHAKEVVQDAAKDGQVAAGDAADAVKGAAKHATDVAKGAAQHATDAAKGAAQHAQVAAKEATGSAKVAAQHAKEAVADAAKDAQHIVGDATDSLKGAATHATEVVSDAAKDAKVAVEKAVDNAKATLKAPASEAVGQKDAATAKSAVEGVVKKGADAVTAAAAESSRALNKSVQQIKDALANLADAPYAEGLSAPISALATTLGSLASVTAEEGREAVKGAQHQLEVLADKLTTLKHDEAEHVQKSLQEQAAKFAKVLEDHIEITQEALFQQATDFENSFGRILEDERELLIKKHDAELAEKLAEQSAALQANLTAELRRQADSLEKHWTKEVKTRVDEERGGRLARLDHLALKVKHLEKLSIEAGEALERTHAVNQLWVALTAVKDALENPHQTPLAKEISLLRNLGDAEQLVATVIGSIPAEVARTGVPTPSELEHRFQAKTAKAVREAQFMSPQAGPLSHTIALGLSKLTFKKEGLVSGDDVESIVARAEYYLKEGDVDSAAREVNQLKGWPKEVARDWLVGARRYLEVKQAIDIVETHLNLLSLGAV